MKTNLITGILAIASLLFTSCLEQETTITVNKDGSGTITEETVFNKDVVDMMDMAAQGAGGQNGAQENPIQELVNKEKAAAKAAQYGEGVKLVSVEPLKRNGGKGAIAKYSFDDINKININPGSALADMGNKGAEVKKGADIKINYADGILTLTMPDPDPEDAKKAQEVEMPDENENPQAAMAMQMMRGMKIKTKLVFPSGIKKTNATHRDGNAIVLMAMDFGKIMDNPDGLKSLKKIDFKDRVAASEQLKGLEGAQIETKKEVTVIVK